MIIANLEHGIFSIVMLDELKHFNSQLTVSFITTIYSSFKFLQHYHDVSQSQTLLNITSDLMEGILSYFIFRI